MMPLVDSIIVSTIASASKAENAWTLLHTTYANASRTRIYSWRDQLSRINKDEKSATEYLHQILIIVDELAAAGFPN